MDNFFVDALVRASLCKLHSSSYPPIRCEGRTLGGGTIRNHPPRIQPTPPRRNYINQSGIIETEPRPPYTPELKSELLSFTDPYFDPSAPPPSPSPSDNQTAALTRHSEQHANAQRLPWLTPSTPSSQSALSDFLLHLHSPSTPLPHLFSLYRALPTPPILHLTLQQINLLIARMMTVPLRTEPTTLRYLSILSDLKSTNLPISRNEYNAALSFITHAFHRVTLDQTKSAITLWKESELLAGIASDTTTFNILLDMASKSDTPVLAKWILKEMDNRGIAPDRFTHTTLITYHGLRGDAESARGAYRALVDAGEIVDTVVLNAVMTALYRCREPQSAEYIYGNMKRAHLEPLGVEAAPTDWRGKREWAGRLKRAASRREYMKEFKVSMAPDVYTFNMLVLHHARMGNYGMAVEFFAEMPGCGVAPDETVFVALLKGFYWYGGQRNSPWTEERLDAVVRMVFDEGRGIEMERSLAVWMLRAVAKVYNSKAKVLRAWEIVVRRWERQGGEVDVAVVEVLRELVGGETMRREREDEGGGL